MQVPLEKWNHSPEVVFKKNDFVISTLRNSSRVMFFQEKNAIHSFENALLGGCYFSRVPQIGLMSVARFFLGP